jgi:high-affinity iron transporter
VKRALSRGSAVALGGTAFLAVYREGVETTLFYQALFAGAGTATHAAVGGFATGCAALAVVYVLFQRFGKRIPIRQFFFITSSLLYYLAFVFAGRGVTALQQVGWVSATPAPGVPRIDLLGVNPTLEALLAQAVLLLLLAYAVVVTLRTRPTPIPTNTLAAEVHRLHELATTMRAELTHLSETNPALRAGLSPHIDAFVNRVAALDGELNPPPPTNGGRHKRPADSTA